MTPSRDTAQRALGAAMNRLARVYRRGVNQALAEHGLSDARALPVLQIGRMGGGVRQVALAEELGIEGPSLVRLLDQLCAAGLVERRDDPSDGRAKTLHLTTEGAALAEVVERALHDYRSKVMARISDTDLAAALRVFAILEADVDDRA